MESRWEWNESAQSSVPRPVKVLEKVVRLHFFRPAEAQPIKGILHQQPRDDVFRLVRRTAPIFRSKHKMTDENKFKAGQNPVRKFVLNRLTRAIQHCR